ncbi:MAG: hypothetical protein AB7T06_16755 [Kofleriaceae bacterium]
MEFTTIDPQSLEHITGGAGEGAMGWVRGALVGAAIAGGGQAQMPPRVEPIRIEQPAPRIGVGQR